LIVGGDCADRGHHRAQEPPLTRARVARHRVASGRLAIAVDGLVQHHPTGKMLVAERRIVDQILIVGDDRTRVAQHLG